MNFRATAFILLIGLVILVANTDAQKKKKGSKSKKDPCHLKEVDACIAKVQALSKRKEPSSLIASDDGLKTICKAVEEDLNKCVKAYMKKCGTPLHREVTDLVVDQVGVSVHRFCDPKNPARAEFLKHSPCIHKKVLSQDTYKHTCNNGFLATLDKIEAQEHADADKNHATLCCGFNRWDSCTKKLVIKECGKEAHEVFADFVGESLGTVTKMVCPSKEFSTKQEICKDLLPNDDVKSKGKLSENAITKYVVSMFSFLFVFDE